MKSEMLSMKKIIVMMVFSMFIVGAAEAQEQQTVLENSLSPKFGAKAGVNFSNLYVNNADDENLKLGLNAGLYAKLPLVRGLSIQPELLFSSKGSKLTYNSFLLGGKGEYRFNLNYVELPVLLVINIAKNLNIHAGPYVSYLVSANIKDLKDNGTIRDIADLNADKFNRIDYGLAGGLAIDIQNFTLGARYNYGLKEIANSTLSNALLGNSKNSVIAVYAGFGF